ncbi:phosphoglycerate mutase family protein [alpha proteobacterium BAL199]|jgi:broad specificity phosphatase PhoE|nr:phosphoglycerate mutase family protein [alpha proteobacterium BAL199]
MPATLYLLRHGETTWNRIGRLQGQLDAPLTRLGLAQIDAVAHCLAGLVNGTSFRLVASPLGRTRQSAAMVAEHLGVDYEAIVWDDRLKEITLGDWDGFPGWGALDRAHPEEAARRNADPWNYRYPNGESSQDVQDRVRPFLAECEAMGGVHVIVAHGVVNKVARGLYLGLTREQTFALDRPQDAFHRLEAGAEATITVDVPDSPRSESTV